MLALPLGQPNSGNVTFRADKPSKKLGQMKYPVRKLDRRVEAALDRPARLVVAALILRSAQIGDGDGLTQEILICQRKPNQPMGLKWEFPGGKVEDGEAPEHAMVRELREELGCEVRIIDELARSRHTYDRGTIEMIPFVCELIESSPAPHPHEHAALVWSLPEELLKHDLAPADYPVVDAFQAWRKLCVSREP